MEQRGYQRDGTAWLREQPRRILADDAGLGKSNQVLRAAEGRTLVVSPAMLADNWMGYGDTPGEAQLWRPDMVEQGLITWTSYSSLPNRVAGANGRKSIVVDVPRPEYRGHWDTIIFDEAHYLKGRSTHWAVAAAKLKADRVYCATGTPLVNWAHEIWMLLRLMMPQHAKPGGRYGNYWNWVGEWFQTKTNFFNARAIDIGDLHGGWTWEEFAEHNSLPLYWLRRERSEVLSGLPPLTYQTILAPMGPEQSKLYKTLEKDLFAIIEETGNEVVVWDSSAVWHKLLKCTTGVESLDPEVKKLGSKMTVMLELMAERHHPTLIFATYRPTVERAAAELNRAGIPTGLVHGGVPLAERRQVVRDFKAGRYRALVGSIGTTSEGLNLYEADTIIRLERDPRPSKNEQCDRRIHRLGQERPCLVIDLVCPNSVDTGMLDLVKTKSDHQMAAMTGFQLAATLFAAAKRSA